MAAECEVKGLRSDGPNQRFVTCRGKACTSPNGRLVRFRPGESTIDGTY